MPLNFKYPASKTISEYEMPCKSSGISKRKRFHLIRRIVSDISVTQVINIIRLNRRTVNN